MLTNRLCLIFTSILLLLIHSGQLTAGETDREQAILIDSKIAKQALKFKVYLPEGYQQSSSQKYPVIYTTAGSRRFELIKQQLDWLSHVDFGPIPPLILVSVPFVEVETNVEPKNVAASGVNSSITLKVMRDEVMPYVKNNYRTQLFNIIEGFSSTGNLPLYALEESPDLFNALIAISPAITLDKSKLIEKLAISLPASDLNYRSLYLSLGSFPQNVAPFNQLKQVLSKYNKTGLDWYSEDLSQDNYLTAVTVALPRALQRIFSDRAPADLSQFDGHGVKEIVNYFTQLTLKYGFMPSPITTLIDFSDRQLSQSKNAGAIVTLEHLVKLKPESVYYHTLLAKAFKADHQGSQAAVILNQALVLAKGQQNDDAINFVTNLLAKIPNN